MTAFFSLIKRNIKLFFNDKGAFFASLITPIILLILYATFLQGVYKSSFLSGFEGFPTPSDTIVGAVVSGELVSSLLAVSCVTVAFCSNMIMVNDKISGAKKDFDMTPVKKEIISISYFFASLFNTLIISFTAFVLGLIYTAFQGWLLSFSDILMLLLAIILLSSFGTILSSIVNLFLSSQGQITAVGTVVSSAYGFIAGAYMPISQYGSFLRNVLMFLPSTYATSIVRNYCLRGAYNKLENDGYPTSAINEIKKMFDCDLYFFSNKVSVLTMFIVLFVSIIVLACLYLLLTKLLKRKKS